MAAQLRRVTSRAFSSSSRRSATPLTEPLPGIPALKPFDSLPRPHTQVTTLSNGLRVASEETYGQVGCVALMSDTGCVYEPLDKRGICHMLDTVAFSGSERFPSQQLTGLMQMHGITAQASSSRDVFMAKVDALRGSVPLAVSMLVDSVFAPTLGEDTLAKARQTIAYQNEAFLMDPSRVVSEVMMEAAFGPGTAAGTSQYASDEGAAAITEDDLRSYVRRMLRPERTVLAGAGVDHDELVAVAEKELGHLRSYDPATDPPEDAPLPDPDLTYHGGLATRQLEPPPGHPEEALAHMSVVFPTMGWRDKRVIPLCVMDTLLGGGSSFSAGGPGKGMYTRLYRETLNTNPWLDALNAFSLTSDDGGVFGIYGAAEPRFGNKLLQVILSNLGALVQRRATPEEIERARNQLRSTVFMNLENRGILAEDIGRQILSLGERMEAEELCDRIASVDQDDLFNVAADILSSKPAIAILNVDVEDRLYDDVESAFAKLATDTQASRA